MCFVKIKLVLLWRSHLLHLRELDVDVLLAKCIACLGSRVFHFGVDFLSLGEEEDLD